MTITIPDSLVVGLFWVSAFLLVSLVLGVALLLVSLYARRVFSHAAAWKDILLATRELRRTRAQRTQKR